MYQTADADLLTSPGWVQVPGFGAMQSAPAAVAPPGTVTVTPTHQAAPGIIQNQNTQVIATPVTGPGGTIAYNLIQNPMPQFHTITIVGADGTEQQVIVPASSLQLSQNLVAQTPAQNPATAFLAPNGQLIATPTGLTMAGNNTVGGLSTLANFAPGNMVNLGGLQNLAVARQGGMMQAMQLQTPQVQTVPIQIQNSAGLMQTIHMPLQAMQAALQPMAGLTPMTGTPGILNISPKQQAALATQYTGAATPQQPVSTDTSLSSVATLSSNNQTTIAVPQSPNPSSISQPTTQPTILSVPVVGSTASCVAMTMQPSNKTAGVLSAAAGTSKLLYTTPSSTATNISGAPAADILSMATANILNPTTPTGLLNNIPSFMNAQQVPGMAGQAQTVQNIILPTGQIVQSLASPVITGMQNIQVVGQNGQMIQAQWLAPMASNVPRPAGIQQLQGLAGMPNLQTYGIQPTFLNTNALVQNIAGATPGLGIQQVPQQPQTVLAQQGIDPSQVVTTAASQQNPVLCKYAFRIQSFGPLFEHALIFIERSLLLLVLISYRIRLAITTI